MIARTTPLILICAIGCFGQSEPPCVERVALGETCVAGSGSGDDVECDELELTWGANAEFPNPARILTETVYDLEQCAGDPRMTIELSEGSDPSFSLTLSPDALVDGKEYADSPFEIVVRSSHSLNHDVEAQIFMRVLGSSTFSNGEENDQHIMLSMPLRTPARPD